ncbi:MULTISPECIES: RagB/SusD family nutrient uptake outer membrane protein [unclassified Flavobacterium]|uniref:RagB/SusD family nutrient uptake outer membrane protein n=1 Tax=unclassified Flavobacterium TaxID=196869 RepID=UPI001F12A1BE|nr:MULTISPECIES: RagB/SusD family nutrient uptake outer membrane protein [unclassified Flavobacterium]UMY65954.1 RagB/SusD family nutrient uptake outer membrane protein [Flavobacterium sp. HJ-32-4]
MKNWKLSITLLATALLSLQACTSDLDQSPKDDDASLADSFYASPSAYKQGLAGVYGNLSLTGTTGAGSSFLQGVDAGTSQFGRCLWYLEDLTTDEVIWSYENDGGVRELQRNIWTDQNPILIGMFSRTMAEVAIANEYLRQTTPEKVSGRGHNDPALLAEIEDYRNEARVLRAYAYYVMMDLFGKAPFVSETDPLNIRGPEYDRAALFAYIESELNAVIPDLKPGRANEYGRVDQTMAQMILAKMYLNAEVYIGENRYADCVTQLNSILGSAYALEANYLDNFKADNNTSTEVIFGLQADGQVTQNYGATTVIINGQVGSIEGNGSQFGVGGWGGALRLRKQMVQKFEGDDFVNDERNTIISGSRDVEITDIANRDQGYILAKFSNISSTGVPGTSGTFVDTDFPVFRLADAYLMYAECAVRGAAGASIATGTNYVNQLRQRANNGSTAANIADGELTLDFILDERARELHWEAHRRQDLIRFGKYTGGSYNWAWKGNGQNGIAISNNFKVFPIPALSIASNPNLTQNTGY